ncbi:4'-phosphopantetheinyl transferase family protein [Streptomyces similanensis]|uniref:4'-phosphopantetheinyl transferase superfamily protein n=1 Tax=Streptomyces similanensis TaxID=1274988 RepID=A0ABP9LES0_9ACTN
MSPGPVVGPLAVAEGVWVVAGSGVPSTHRDDRRRAAALPEWRARRFLHGRGLLRELLHTVAPPLAGADIVPDERGRPRLAGRPGAAVSVSHSDSMVACAFAAEGRVGVDLQHPAASVGATLARRLLRAHAPGVLALAPARAAAEVAWVWTAQEACVKAAGTGLAGRPWEIDVPPGSLGGRWGPYRWICLRSASTTPLSCAMGPVRADGADGAHPTAFP